MSKLNIAIVGLCVFAAGLLLALLVVACQPRLPGSTQEAQEAQEAHEGTVEEVAQAKPASGGASDIVDGDLLGNKIVELLPFGSAPGQARPRIRFEDPDRVSRIWSDSGVDVADPDLYRGVYVHGDLDMIYVCGDPDLRLVASITGRRACESVLMTQKRTPAGVWKRHGKHVIRVKNGDCGLSYYKMGKLYGRRRLWGPDGQPRIDEFWLNGREAGLHRVWYADGRKKREINYVNGVMVSAKAWCKDGVMVSGKTWYEDDAAAFGKPWCENGEFWWPSPVQATYYMELPYAYLAKKFQGTSHRPASSPVAGIASDIMDGDLLGNKIVALLPPADSPPGQAWPRIKFENPEFGVQTWTHSERVDPRSYRTFHSMSGAVYVCDGPLVIPEWRAQDETTLSAVDVRLLVLIGGHATHESILVAEKRTPGGDWEPHGKCVIRDKDGGYGSGYHDTGELAGRWEMCWSNGQPRIREYWKDGREVGMELAWYENGQKRYEIRHYSNGTDMMGETWDIAGAHQVFSHMDGKILLDGEWREDGQRRLFHSLTKGNSSWTSPKK